jgi:hypothetical protein
MAFIASSSNMETVTMHQLFKRCTLCGKEWATREEFLNDVTLELNGHQWNKKKVLAGEPSEGLLIFTHRIRECGTSLALTASKFRQRMRRPLPE